MLGSRFHTFSAAALAALVFLSILLMWVPDLWAATLPQAGIFALAIAWMARLLWRPYRAEWSPVLIPLAGMALWGLLQLAARQTVYRWDTWNAVLFWATNLAACFLGLQIFADRRLRDLFLRAVLIFGVAVAVVATLQLFTAGGKVFWLFPTPYKSFVLGPFVYKNQYAAFIELVLPLALAAAVADERRALIYLTAAAAMYASVIAATSRAGFVLASLEIACILPLALARGLISRRRLATLAAAMAAFAGLFIVTTGWQSLQRKFEQGNQDMARRQFLRSALGMARERPWMGFGLGTWSTVYPGYAYFDDGTFANQAHNDWVQWAAEGGIPFFALALAVAAWSFRPAVRSLWGLGVVAVFAHCLVDYPLQIQRPALSVLFFILLAALAGLQVTKARPYTSR